MTCEVMQEKQATGATGGPPTPRRTLTTKAFARYLGVTPRTVYRWIRDGWIHPCRNGGRWMFGDQEIADIRRRT